MISPELALIDEDLEAEARLALPEAHDRLPPARDRPVPVSGSARRWHRVTWLRSSPVLIVAVVIVVVALPQSSGKKASTSASNVTHKRSTSRPTGQRERPVRLSWRPIRRAAFYNVIFWQNGTRALDLWPTKASMRVPDGRLAPGVYQWFVYPAFNAGGARRYGRVIARGRLRI